jgi:hypothetical protein
VSILSSMSLLQKRWWLLFSAGCVLVPWYWRCVVRSRFFLMGIEKRKKEEKAKNDVKRGTNRGAKNRSGERV